MNSQKTAIIIAAVVIVVAVVIGAVVVATTSHDNNDPLVGDYHQVKYNHIDYSDGMDKMKIVSEKGDQDYNVKITKVDRNGVFGKLAGVEFCGIKIDESSFRFTVNIDSKYVAVYAYKIDDVLVFSHIGVNYYGVEFNVATSVFIKDDSLPPSDFSKYYKAVDVDKKAREDCSDFYSVEDGVVNPFSIEDHSFTVTDCQFGIALYTSVGDNIFNMAGVCEEYNGCKILNAVGVNSNTGDILNDRVFITEKSVLACSNTPVGSNSSSIYVINFGEEFGVLDLKDRQYIGKETAYTKNGTIQERNNVEYAFNSLGKAAYRYHDTLRDADVDIVTVKITDKLAFGFGAYDADERYVVSIMMTFINNATSMDSLATYPEGKAVEIHLNERVPNGNVVDLDVGSRSY